MSTYVLMMIMKSKSGYDNGWWWYRVLIMIIYENERLPIIMGIGQMLLLLLEIRIELYKMEFDDDKCNVDVTDAIENNVDVGILLLLELYKVVLL